MLKESYSPKFYSYYSKYISNILALRQPQYESLEVFARLCDVLSLSKNPDLNAELQAVHELFPTFGSFERHFPSVCFALATGVGKTRLMGACIAYLCYEKQIRNFFVIAPNLAIYRKLKSDLGDPSSKKYVFRGLDLFVSPPHIIDGDNYGQFRQTSFGMNDIVINVFNIAKLYADSKSSDGSPARIKRLNEVLGESYFEHLKSLPDLCVFMDESHHYHADKSFDVINELKPVLGVELTATPQIQKGNKTKIPFRNVVYEYSLAHALQDKQYVKVPAVFTRRDFRPEEYTEEQLDHEKLNDGLRIHEETRNHLEVYARNYGKPVVHPFVLVVAKNTEHSRQIMEYITSPEFFGGYYADKVMEINSALKGAEKDENIERLLKLENPDNKIEIVIHVNMLKEGWDVSNLYTIIPLRVSASDTLTEQTIGRGLRLPYGERTGVDEVDRLSIVSHDKYAEIIRLANDPDSLVRKVYLIEEAGLPEKDERYETVKLPSSYEAVTTDSSFTDQLNLILQQECAKHGTVEKSGETTAEMAKFMMDYTADVVMDLNRQIKTYDAVHDEEARKFAKKSVISEVIRRFPESDLKPEELDAAAEKAVEACVQALTDKVIPVPQAVIQPFAETGQGFIPFKLNVESLNWRPSDDTLPGTELQENGRTFTVDSGNMEPSNSGSAEDEIIRFIAAHDNVDYSACAGLLYSLIKDAREYFLTYLTEDETEQVMRERQRTLADIIYTQMNEHFYHKAVSYRASKILPFSRIAAGFGGKLKSDEIYDLHTSFKPGEIKTKIFKGFRKACHTLYKFDSSTELDFAIVLEDDSDVLKWMRPAAAQFDIRYGSGKVSRYEPDFIVETAAEIWMVETKAAKDMQNKDVIQKAEAGTAYCSAVTEWNTQNGGKPWRYALIPHNDVR